MDYNHIAKIVGVFPDFLFLPLLYIIRYKFYKNILGFKNNIYIYIFVSLLLTLFDVLTMNSIPKALGTIFNNVLLLLAIHLLCKGNLIIKLYIVIIENTIFLLVGLITLPFDFWISPVINSISMSFRIQSTLLLISIPMVAYSFKKLIESDEQKHKAMLIEQQFAFQLNHMKNVDGIYLGIRKVIHDMNNHITCLKNLADNNNNKEIKEYLHNLSETVSKLDFRIKTGNPICDAVINEKFSISQNERIEFISDFIIFQNTSLEPIDLCVILGNALDNSIEACRKITNPNIKKKISIKSNENSPKSLKVSWGIINSFNYHYLFQWFYVILNLRNETYSLT